VSTATRPRRAGCSTTSARTSSTRRCSCSVRSPRSTPSSTGGAKAWPSDDDTFVALHHVTACARSCGRPALAGTRNPRFRVLGTGGTFTKYGLDVQEPQIKDGKRPGDDGWGVEPASDAGVLGVNDDVETVPTETGRYEQFYREVRDALLGEGEFPVDPASAVRDAPRHRSRAQVRRRTPGRDGQAG